MVVVYILYTILRPAEQTAMFSISGDHSHRMDVLQYWNLEV